MSRAVETRTEASLAAQDIARRACDMLSDGAAPASLSDQQVTRAIRVHAFRGWAAQQSPQLQQIVDTRLAVPELDTPLGGVVFTGQLGVLYEALLSLSLRRMTKGAIQLENRGWITREELEALPVAKRSRLLKTRAGSQVLRRLGDLESRDLWRRLQPHVTDRCMEDRWVVDDRGDRRSKGAHYTPSAIVEQVVERALGPLTCAANLADIPRFRIVDPACGAGVFLVAVAKFLAQHLEKSGSSLQLRDVAEQCLAAVDEDPLALTIAACELHAATGARAHRLKAQLHVGDAVLTRCNNSGGGPATSAASETSFTWKDAFADTFAERGGFDAVVGNPPWIAYVGRAAQPLCEARAKAFRQYESFAGYRTLHGIFVEQSSRLLRPGGRLALVLPTSVSDLQGYKGTRRAHDRRCIVDSPLPDLGANAFADVFQPSMVLLSTRRNNDAAGPTDGAKWHVERKDLMRWERALLERMRGAPTFSKNCFGERGYQTTPADLSQIREANPPPCQEEVYLRTGADILEGQLRPPVWCVCPSRLRGNLRPKAQWQAVDVLIRQTARYPIACLGDGKAFRNSVLAGFSDGDIPPQSLVLYLNCSLIRWFHFKSHRDARQGMPQVKVGHLRMLPKIPSLDTAGGQKLHSLSQRHGGNGLSKPMRRLVDRVVAEHFQLTDQESTEISRWSSAHLPPTPRPRNNMDRA